MRPVECEACGNEVLVEKFSAQQISVQWNAIARESCPLLGSDDSLRSPGVGSCEQLRLSIDTHVRSGDIAPTLRNEEPTHGVY